LRCAAGCPQNVYLKGVILGMTRAEVRRKFDEIVAFAGLEDFIDTPVKRYSSGMYARLGFSVAAHMQPDILIVDEVLSVGDFVFQAKSIEKMRSVLRSGATVLFVSHNLRAMADLCDRAILLRQGRLVEDGETSRVIHRYMEQIKQARALEQGKEVVIEELVVEAGDGMRFDFESGEKARVRVTLRALSAVSKVACVLYVLDEMYYEVFNTSSERLGLPPIDLAAGETATCEFELQLHLAAGNFHLCAMLYRYDIGKTFDQLQPAATLLMRSRDDVRGVANLYPRVVGVRRSG
jgi:lipopolysaccharide transport system ATP-binding protein